MIEFQNVSKAYSGEQVALRDLSVRIPQGELVFLTGPSGAGKSTFLQLIYCEERPTTGYVLVNGRNLSSLPRRKIPYLRRSIGVVFQNFRLIDRKTVFENVAYLPRILGLDTRSQRRVAYQALKKVGLGHRMSSFPHQLSGGEKQRVAIARAIVSEPEIVLADEPTGNLDPELSEQILQLFLEIQLAGATLILATHDRDLIERVGNRVLTLRDGQLVDDRKVGPGIAPRRHPATVNPVENPGP